MARRNYRKSSKKIQPAVETLTFYLGATGSATELPGFLPGQSTYYCDLSQVASLANRRFYRQGLNWAVAGMRVNSTMVNPGTTVPTLDAPEGTVVVQKLPNTWVMSNAWEKGFRAWQKMNREALEESESIKPKFLDFKIYMDSLHHSDKYGFVQNILPCVLDTDAVSPTTGYTDATPGEWISSKYAIPATDGTGNVNEREVIAVGANFPGLGSSGLNAVSLIEGYASSRGLPDIKDPNAPDDSAGVSGNLPANWLAAIFNEGTDQTTEVIEEMLGSNNIAPYPFENDGTNTDTMYPGGVNQLDGLQLHSLENITGTTVGGVTYLKGGSFPCGLIRIDVFNNNGTLDMLNMLQIDLVPGTHRGYLAEPMTEM